MSGGSIETISKVSIPWNFENESAPLFIPAGTRAVVPVLDNEGQRTGKFEELSYEDYLREMGKAAVTKIDEVEYYMDSSFTLRPWWTEPVTEEGEI